MKYISVAAVAALLLTSGPLTALCEESCHEDGRSENPLFVRAFFDYICESKFEDDDDPGKIQYNTGGAELTSFVFYDETRMEGATVGLNYTNYHLNWDENPFFHQKNFNEAGIRVSAFSGRLCNWMWKAFINCTLDIDHPNFTYYSLWDIAAWGKYTYSDCLDLSIGFYAQTGMKADRVWPVIGFDWDYSEKIRVMMVFPNDMHVMYKLSDSLSAGVCFNVYRSRNRTGNDETLERAVWVYENSGVEFCLDYIKSELTYACAHIGYTLGGKLKIANRHYEDAHHFDFKAAPYAGCSAGLKF